MDTIYNIVEEFISKIRNFRKDDDSILDLFSNGYCYYFSLMLQDRFGGEILYDPIEGHFLLYFKNHLYDITGDVTNKYRVDELYDKEYWIRKRSILYGCILKIDI